MTILLHAARLALPTLFFGYAVFANLALLSGPLPDVRLPTNGVLSGGLTQNLDSLYKKDLPHMALSFGLIGAARYALLDEARQGAVVGQAGWLFTAEEVRALPSDQELAAILRTIAGVRAQLASAGTDLVMVPLPAKIDIYRNLAPEAGFGVALESLYAQFITRLGAHGIGFVDARQALANPLAPVFFATDTHWTPLGAERVASAVVASGTIAAGDLLYGVTPAAAKTLTGDLVSYVSTAALAPRIGLPLESVATVTQTLIEEPSDIFGTSSQDIVLVGTSYSANPDWGFADALMRNLGRDVISVAEQGLGPLQPMQHYLASADFRQSPPKVVIWEIPIRYLTDPALWPADVASDLSAQAQKSLENPDG